MPVITSNLVEANRRAIAYALGHLLWASNAHDGTTVRVILNGIDTGAWRLRNYAYDRVSMGDLTKEKGTKAEARAYVASLSVVETTLAELIRIDESHNDNRFSSVIVDAVRREEIARFQRNSMVLS